MTSLYDEYDDFEYLLQTFLAAVQAKCPNLLEFEIERPQVKSQADALLRFLEGTPTVHKVTIVSNRRCQCCDLRPGVARDAFYYLFGLLASHAPLQDLDWKMLLTQDIIKVAEEDNTAPFRNLVHLDVHANSKGIEAFLSHLRNLKALDLHLDDDLRFHTPLPSTVLSSVSLCGSLRKLNFICSDDYVLVPLELMTLACGCSQLESLIIRNTSILCDATAITDTILEQVVYLLPCLRNLELETHGPLSTRSLIALGQHCPDLEKLEIGGIFDLSVLTTMDNVLFPNLNNLHLQRLKYWENSS